MKKLIIISLMILLTCKTPLPMYKNDADKDIITNRIKIVNSDSISININYYFYREDSIIKIKNKQE